MAELERNGRRAWRLEDAAVIGIAPAVLDANESVGPYFPTAAVAAGGVLTAAAGKELSRTPVSLLNSLTMPSNPATATCFSSPRMLTENTGDVSPCRSTTLAGSAVV
ncbi:MAG UNVERIFIED_CONTAM: hypothetical protein LVR18_50470 [Planctomycetaceae bacterium]